MSTPLQQLTVAYERYADAIFRHCYFRLRDRELGKELMQETFTRTWEYIAEGNIIENMRAFLYRIANNLIVDHVRRKREVSLDALQEAGFDPGVDQTQRMQDKIDAAAIIATLHQIEAPYREVLIMRYIDELLPSEIAAITSLSSNVISVRIHRGMQKLRSLLDSHE